MSGEAILLGYLSIFGFMVPFVITLMFFLLLLTIKTNLIRNDNDSSLPEEDTTSIPSADNLNERITRKTSKKLVFILVMFQFLFWAPRLVIQVF